MERIVSAFSMMLSKSERISPSSSHCSATCGEAPFPFHVHLSVLSSSMLLPPCRKVLALQVEPCSHLPMEKIDHEKLCRKVHSIAIKTEEDFTLSTIVTERAWDCPTKGSSPKGSSWGFSFIGVCGTLFKACWAY